MTPFYNGRDVTSTDVVKAVKRNKTVTIVTRFSPYFTVSSVNKAVRNKAVT